ncbi:hypothetical protein [Actinoplanes couchii]|uniref:Immunity protein 35 domain-containing protein n=1 Tax=Actinoplanes couchii TaxID=403638 RepID=A0ABQ3XNQ7_9ACTN|nr:hypothetical protein [Actinoplanes couchii]MDR6319632.1 hypothetical protein [Actinoplanes couchii]GID60145.1 hypothetical protein Aco03nite_085490 [Actinoplanes couchii]
MQHLLSRTDAVYQRWLTSITDDVDAGEVVIFCRESLPERHTTYEIGEWLPGFLMIGQDGDRGLFLACDGGGGPVFRSDLGGPGEADHEIVAPDFAAWQRSGFPLPREPELPLTADVWVDDIPINTVQLLVRMRKLLGADWRFGELRNLLATQPFLAARSAHPYALLRRLEDAPELRPHLFYAGPDGLRPVWSLRGPQDTATAMAQPT